LRDPGRLFVSRLRGRRAAELAQDAGQVTVAGGQLLAVLRDRGECLRQLFLDSEGGAVRLLGAGQAPGSTADDTQVVKSVGTYLRTPRGGGRAARPLLQRLRVEDVERLSESFLGRARLSPGGRDGAQVVPGPGEVFAGAQQARLFLDQFLLQRD